MRSYAFEFFYKNVYAIDQGWPAFYYEKAIINIDQHVGGCMFCCPLYIVFSAEVTITAVT